MAQVFKPYANTLARASIVCLGLAAAGGLGFLDVLHKSPYVRYTREPRAQPIPFSHKHHTNMGIDCRYCHTTVETGAFAGIPPTQTCMNCHKVLFTDAPILAPLHESWETGRPLKWVRVHDLPDFVYFNHSAHVNAGIGCATCHGQVNEMPLMWKEHPLFMKWCLECHRSPEDFIRPRDQVFNMDYQPPANQRELGQQLVEEYGIDKANHRMTDCYLCHR